MARRQSTPLYELIMSGRRPGAVRTHSGVEPVVVEETDEGPVVVPDGSGGTTRVVRVPMGFLLLAVAGLVVGLVLAYMWGSFQGGRAAKAQFEEEWLSGGLVAPRAADPLSDPSSGPANETGRAVPPAPSDGTDSIETSAPPPSRPPGVSEGPGSEFGDQGWGPIESDPRRDGEHYLVLAETRPEGAMRLATFAREHGLETYVIPSHNPRFRRVIALPGVAKRSESSPEVRSLRETVMKVGTAWKAKYPGESDLSDAYLIP